jgi:hypothetical protein
MTPATPTPEAEEARTEAARLYLERVELACVELGPEMLRAIERGRMTEKDERE